MAGHRQLTDDTYDGHRTYGRFYKPLDKTLCKDKNCQRSPYLNGHCKKHFDMKNYKKAIRQGG